MGQNMIKSLDQGMFGYWNVFHGMYKVMIDEGILSLWKGCGAWILHMST